MMSLRRYGNVRAFSLVEVAVASCISLLAIAAIISVFITSSKMAVASYLQNKAAMEARTVVDHLTSDVRMASAVENSYSTYTADANTLILKVPSIDSAGFPVDPANNFDRIIYHKDSTSPTKLKRKVVADALSSRISEDEFVGSSVTPGVYTVQPDAVGEYIVYYKFVSIQSYGAKSIEVPISGSVQLRNHA